MPPGRAAVAKLAAISPGGVYRLSADSDGAGDAGSPLFDQRGRLVAIETPSDPLRPRQVFAISVRVALESLGQEFRP